LIPFETTGANNRAAMNDKSVNAVTGSASPFDALLFVSFGGPEGPDDVMPFLENVVRGKNVPRERLLQVAKHYELFGGVSPINGQCRALLASLVAELSVHGPQLSIYWANRHWHPLLPDVVEQMAEDGVQRALAFVTSAFGSYSGCREYREEIEQSRQTVGADAPQIEKLRLFYNHPGFIEAVADRVTAALGAIPAERRENARLVFTAHSLPLAAAEGSPYQHQLREACRLVVDRLEASGQDDRSSESNLQITRSPNHQTSNPQSPIPSPSWDLVYQSRSGPPSQAWLEPDVQDHIRRLHDEGTTDVVLSPIGFLLENVEVIYDLDVEVASLCEELGVNLIRAGVAGNHPRLVRMIRELIVERLDPASPRLSLGADGPWPDDCPDNCCPRRP
jgi:protoporphyrin/coproporphyrin ferrochelatase